MSGFTLFTSNTERFRTIRRTLAFYARGKDEERAQVGLDEIEVADQRLHEMNDRLADENLSLRTTLERDRTKADYDDIGASVPLEGTPTVGAVADRIGRRDGFDPRAGAPSTARTPERLADDFERVRLLVEAADKHSRQPIDLNYIAVPKDAWEDITRVVRSRG